MWLHVVIVMVLLISHCPANDESSAQKYQNTQPPSTPRVSPYWENILREFVFKTISPLSCGNNALYKRILEAPFYGGPFPEISKDEGSSSVILSRGDVYHLPNGHWLLCQEGCVDCDVCLYQKRSTVKWILRRIKRISSSNSLRYDFQLTIIPQFDESSHIKNAWPRSYVYVTSQTEESEYFRDFYNQLNGVYPYTGNPNNSFDNRKINDLWQLRNPDSWFEQRGLTKKIETSTIQVSSRTDEQYLAPTEQPKTEDSMEHENKVYNNKRRQPRVKAEERHQIVPLNRSIINNIKRNDTESLNNYLLNYFKPKLILGTDQQGQKQLVHVVPAEHTTTTMSSRNPSLAKYFNSSAIQPHFDFNNQNDKSAYQRILRRIFESLNSHRHYIENFLRPPMNEFGRSQDIPFLNQMNPIQSRKPNLHSLTTPWDIPQEKDINVKLNETHFNGMTLPLFMNQDRENSFTLSRDHVNRSQNDANSDINDMRFFRRKRPVNIDFDRLRRKARRQININTKINITQHTDQINNSSNYSNGTMNAKEIDLNNSTIYLSSDDESFSSQIPFAANYSDFKFVNYTNSVTSFNPQTFRIIVTTSPSVQKQSQVIINNNYTRPMYNITLTSTSSNITID